MGVELPLRVVVTILECCVTFSGVKLSIRSFVLFIWAFEAFLSPAFILNLMQFSVQPSVEMMPCQIAFLFSDLVFHRSR